MKKHWNLLLPILTLTLLVSCSAKKKMDEMHESTVAMRKSTEIMGKDVESTKDTSNNMFQLIKQGDGSMTRSHFFNEILSAKTMGDKKVAAVTYFYAFEFQTWNKFKDKAWDAMEYRELVIDKAVDELANHIEQFIVGDSPETAYESSDNNVRSLYAIALVLHEENHAQAGLLAGTGIKNINLLDIIMQGLRTIEPYNKGEITELKEWERKVHIYADRFIYLLKARYMITPVAALSFISDLGATKNRQPIIGSLLNNISILQDLKTTKLKEQAKKFNRGQVEFFNEIVECGTIKVGEFLKEIGEFKPLEERTIKIYKNLYASMPKFNKGTRITPMNEEVIKMGRIAGKLVEQNVNK